MGGGVGGWIKCTTQLLLFIWHNLNRQSRGLSKAGSAGGQSIERQERHSPPPPHFLKVPLSMLSSYQKLFPFLKLDWIL